MVNSICKGFVTSVFPWLQREAMCSVLAGRLLSGCLLEVIGFFRSLFKIRNPTS